MSNVLTGIIGVILFIGLALAGAFYLGVRFREATQNSKVTAAVQLVSQVAQAANLYRLDNGADVTATSNLTAVLVDTGYIRSIPAGMHLIDAAGFAASAQPSATAIYSIGTDDEARLVCETVERQMGRASLDTTDRSFNRSRLKSNVGCKSNGTVYFVFAQL